MLGIRDGAMVQDPKLDRLLTYTTFHIGVYLSLFSAVIGIDVLTENINDNLLRFSAFCMLLAGIFGGAIGSNIPEAETYDSVKISLFGVPFLSLKWCIHMEHFFFWLGIGPPAVLYIAYGVQGLS